MQKLNVVAGAALAALAVGLTAVGCGSSTETESATTSVETTTAEAAETTTETTDAPAASGEALDDYLAAHNITTTVVHPGEGPTVTLPVPPGWSKAEPSGDASFGGLVLTKPVSPNDPPRINAHVVKLTGDVDQEQVLTLASSDLKSIPGFQSLGEVTDKEMSGFRAAQTGGSYTKAGNNRLVAQKSVVIPTDGGVYLLQLTADGLESDMGPLMDATAAIDKEATITP